MHDSQQKSSRWFTHPQIYKRRKYDTKDCNNSRIGATIQDLIFFTLFYLYLWLYVDMRLIYHGAGVITNFPSFYKGWAFFQTFLPYPGGPVEYLSAFLSQLFYYSWVGALVVTVQAWFFSGCISYLLKAMNFPRARWIRFIIPVLLLIIYTQYTYFFPTTLALTAALIFIFLYLKINSSRDTIIIRAISFLFLSVFLYYLAGGAFLLFATVCAAYELFFRFRWITGLFYLSSATVIPYVMGRLIFDVSIINAFCNLLPFSWKILYYETRRRGVTTIYLLYLFPPLMLLVFGLWQVFVERLHFIKSRTTDKKQQNKSFNLLAKIFPLYRHSPKLRWTLELLLVLVIAGSAVYYSRNDNLRTQFKVDYFSYHKMWPELIASARSNPTNPLIVHAVNRALYHTGRLGYEMFFWPQNTDSLFLADPAYQWHYWQRFNAYLDIGYINMAENLLTECLEGLGDRPMVLQKLALINMVKNNTDTARVYLNTLNKTLYYTDWARHYLNLLQTDPNLSSDKYIQQLRSISLDKDYSTTSIPAQNLLILLLEKNSKNKMAFEYSMAWYMLNKHLGNFVQNIERLRDFGYSEIPTHYEEASLVYVASTQKRVRIKGYKASDTLRQRIDDFGQILRKYGANKQAAYNELADKYRNTYFFYFLYAPSGTKE
jgi:hypothetical protein